LSESDDVLKTVLLDMTQNATLEHSNLAAKKVLANLQKVGAVHKGRVQKAGFVVLKSPDMPSMLVETAFISNPEEERRLRDSEHQEKLAAAILAGARSYFLGYAPPGTKLAAAAGSDEGHRRYVISRGDTLGEIAELYHVSLTSLRSVNHIEGDYIRAGQVLTIPES
jgi:N-acetylmuramoyl-L-alanine amidase